jgi:hypothetical protein
VVAEVADGDFRDEGLAEIFPAICSIVPESEFLGGSAPVWAYRGGRKHREQQTKKRMPQKVGRNSDSNIDVLHIEHVPSQEHKTITSADYRFPKQKCVTFIIGRKCENITEEQQIVQTVSCPDCERM